MKLALAQMEMGSDMESNFKKSIRLMRDAAKQGAELICFPEIQLTPFFPQYEQKDVTQYLMKTDSLYVRGMCEVCRELRIYASPNFYMEENGGTYDMSLLIDDTGSIIGSQKMVHVAQCERFYEQSYYKPSEEGFRVFDTRFGKIGIVVCFDRHYPESIRTEALRGAELILIPTANTTAEPSELFQWEVKVQAFQSSVNIAMCNRIGTEDEMVFSGESIVADYSGATVALAGSGEELLLAEVDMSGASAARAKKPYTDLRRSEWYE
ncbi:MAG: carbon-nitrogen hydrolase family protein [Lachnospiraceae bacterium]|nr:carbon-nitrogen hydrolase family protein [Lachnospiraceae bacterium]